MSIPTQHNALMMALVDQNDTGKFFIIINLIQIPLTTFKVHSMFRIVRGKHIVCLVKCGGKHILSLE